MLTRGGLSRPINVEGSAVDPDAVCWIVRVGEYVKDARNISRLSIASVRGTGGKQAAETAPTAERRLDMTIQDLNPAE